MNRELVAGDECYCYGRPSDGVKVIEAVAAAGLYGENGKFVSGGVSWTDSEE